MKSARYATTVEWLRGGRIRRIMSLPLDDGLGVAGVLGRADAGRARCDDVVPAAAAKAARAAIGQPLHAAVDPDGGATAQERPAAKGERAKAGRRTAVGQQAGIGEHAADLR